MAEDDYKIVNDVIIAIDRITETTVYFTRFRCGVQDGNEWPLYKMDRENFERLWDIEAVKAEAAND